MAVRNGHLRIAALLLQQGSDWKHPDSSNNTPLHYAAGAGFIECINLLIKTGADVNAMNSWKVTPITIAMLNNHLGTVKRFLEEPDVDVNGKDDKGRTLLLMALLNIEDNSCLEFTKYLIDKGADVNMGDVEKESPLHVLARTKPQLDHTLKSVAAKKAQQNRVKKVLSDLIDLLLVKGGDLSALNEKGQTPFEVALDCDNIDVLSKFTKVVSVNKSPKILHKFASKIFDERFRDILITILTQEVDLKNETMNLMDDDGFSPMLLFIKQYVKNLSDSTFKNLIHRCLQWNAVRYQKQFNRYQVTNTILYSPELEDEHDRAMNVFNLSEQEIADQVKSYTKKLFTDPFIELLEFLVSKGCDAHAEVGKKRFYRELDEHKRHLENVEANRGAI